MSAGTKVTVAIVVLFAAVLGIYYGFGGSGGAGAMPAELLPPAEQDPDAPDGNGASDSAPLAVNTNNQSGGDLARSIEEALWAQGGATTDATGGVLGSDGGSVTPVQPADDPWVLRAPTLMPEPETRAVRPAGRVVPKRTVEYVVQPNDSMWTISKRWFGDATRWGEIAAGNPQIDPERLRVGQRIQLPARKEAGAVGMNQAVAIPAARSTTPKTSGRLRYYTVRTGDTLSTIAETHYSRESRWREIFNANQGVIGSNPDRLKVGMKLRIP